MSTNIIWSWYKGKLTFNFDGPDPGGCAKLILNPAHDLLVVIIASDVGDLEVEPELALDQLLIHIPLVAVLVDWRIGSGWASENCLKIKNKQT